MAGDGPVDDFSPTLSFFPVCGEIKHDLKTMTSSRYDHLQSSVKADGQPSCILFRASTTCCCGCAQRNIGRHSIIRSKSISELCDGRAGKTRDHCWIHRCIRDLITKAKSSGVFNAYATHAAVLVVFVSGNLGSAGAGSSWIDGMSYGDRTSQARQGSFQGWLC